MTFRLNHTKVLIILMVFLFAGCTNDTLQENDIFTTEPKEETMNEDLSTNGQEENSNGDSSFISRETREDENLRNSKQEDSLDIQPYTFTYKEQEFEIIPLYAEILAYITRAREAKIDDWDAIYKEEDRAVFLYYDANNCIGQLKIRSNWNGYAFIEDIAVANGWRKQGIGTALLEKAIEWAKQNSFTGLMLETQDVNVSACHFYAKNRFVMGAVDIMLYSNFPTANEKAIFWYYKF